MTPDAYCQQKSAASGSSFYYSFLFLPQPRRRAIMALYAFCREVDDVVDENLDPDIARTKLHWWRTEIARLDSSAPTHPVTQAIGALRSDFRFDSARLLEIIDGMQMDLDQSRYGDFETLSLYCHRVAGVVGTMAAEIFGFQHESTLRYAEKLGLALQLTNIIRDVGEDARRGRIYLPIDDLARFDVPANELLKGVYSDRFQKLMQFQADRAIASFQEALALLSQEDRRAQRPGLIMGQIYATLLDEIMQDSFQVLHQRTSLTPLRKLWLAWRTWTSSNLRLPTSFLNK
jgi:15-cis-phytoene synthase